MKKTIAFSLVLVLLVGLLAGCAGTAVVYYSDSTCPHDKVPVNPPAEGAVKTGLAVITSVKDSENAKVAKYDVTLVAVTVDDNGIIEQCIIDSIGTEIGIDGTGALTKVPENVATIEEFL